jgi:hypothetical protein
MPSYGWMGPGKRLQSLSKLSLPLNNKYDQPISHTGRSQVRRNELFDLKLQDYTFFLKRHLAAMPLPKIRGFNPRYSP